MSTEQLVNGWEAAYLKKCEELAALQADLQSLQVLACDFIGPDEDGKPECVCCGMQLEGYSKGHKQDCLANLVLQIKLPI